MLGGEDEQVKEDRKGWLEKAGSASGGRDERRESRSDKKSYVN